MAESLQKQALWEQEHEDEHNRRSGDDLKITETEGCKHVGGTWVSGSIAGHTFQVLVFKEHAECEDCELGTSRISRLWLRRQADRQLVANFDRGWDIEPTSPAFAQMTASTERSRESHKRHPLKCRRVTPIAADESDAIPMRIWLDKSVPAKGMHSVTDMYPQEIRG